MFPQLQAIILGIKAAKNFILIGLFIGLMVACYMKGRHDVQVKWDMQRADDKVAVAQVSAKSAQVTTQVVVKYVDRIKTITIKGKEIVKYIHDGISKQEDDHYKLPNNFVSLYNDSVQNVVPDPTTSTDDAASAIKLSQALDVISTNNTQCNAYRQQVISLQDWITQQEKIYNKN